jgi:cytochrome c biogenesis protein CcmG/thiol:disulfide interchange protein DsbE
MNWLKGLVLLLLLGMVTTTWAQREIPSVKLRTLKGKMVDIQEYTGQGKPTIISFWATWCAPCKKELDAIALFFEDWQVTYGVELLAISIDDQRALAKVGPMVQSKGWPFTVLSDSNQQLKNALNFQSVPQTFLLDKDGRIVYSHTGYVPGDEYELEDKIREVVSN